MKEFLTSLPSHCKIKHGRANEPRDQGCVERFNATIMLKLKQAFLNTNGSFKLETALDNILQEYRRTKHRSTKEKPVVLFYCDPHDEKVKSAMENQQLRWKTTEIDLKSGEIVILEQGDYTTK